MATYKGYPLELELLITLGSIHPWLIKTAACADKFFSPEELLPLEQYKYDLHKGSKVKFVLNLVYRVTRKEKVLIFCHNIAPVKLFLELFERVFHWERGREVLVLTGDLELFERGKVMDKFEKPGGASRVLLASITACAEGISLTAASRVILLDSEWNPSKTKQAIARAFRPGQQKVVYVYQLLATGTLEEDKYRRTTWKEWVSSMIFSEAFVEDPSRWQAEKIEDDILREMVGEDKSITTYGRKCYKNTATVITRSTAHLELKAANDSCWDKQANPEKNLPNVKTGQNDGVFSKKTTRSGGYNGGGGQTGRGRNRGRQLVKTTTSPSPRPELMAAVTGDEKDRDRSADLVEAEPWVHASRRWYIL
ncbi:hypothetical protein ACLB2K_076038 [Fragaria x ananassa]